MREISQTGHPTGGTARLAITLMAFFVIGALIIEPAWKRHPAYSDPGKIVNSAQQLSVPITLACISFYIYFIGVGLRTGFPIFSGVERLDFKYQLSDPIYSSLLGNRPLFVSAMSLLSIAPATRRRAQILFLGMLLISIAFGEKFTSLINMCAIFPAARLLVYLREHRALPISKMMFFGLAVGVLTIGTCLNVYLYIYNDFDTAKMKLLDRMAEQGEMWYVGDRDYRFNTHIDWNTIALDLAACSGQSSQNPQDISTDFGPFFVMQHYADQDYLENGQEKGIYFAFTYATYWLMISGYSGFTIVWILTSIAYGLAGRVLLIGLVEGSILATVFGQKATSQIYTAVITGFTYYVIGYKAILVFSIGFLAIYLQKIASTSNVRPSRSL